jgi:hypothetical protein
MYLNQPGLELRVNHDVKPEQLEALLVIDQHRGHLSVVGTPGDRREGGSGPSQVACRVAVRVLPQCRRQWWRGTGAACMGTAAATGYGPRGQMPHRL